MLIGNFVKILYINIRFYIVLFLIFNNNSSKNNEFRIKLYMRFFIFIFVNILERSFLRLFGLDF